VALDLTRVAVQVGDMIARIKGGETARQQRLATALATLLAQDVARLRRKIKDSKTTWLVAGLVETLGQHIPSPPAPGDFTVLATDGSNISIDRHQAARCYLINIGAVSLRYGANPDASLQNFPCLCSTDEELVIKSGSREQTVEGNLLGIKRSVDECQQLTTMASALPPGSRALALLDGSLILWGLEAYPEFITDELLAKGLLRCLDRMKALNGQRQLALASYISLSRSNDVANALRLALCPREVLDSDRDCPDCPTKECNAISGVQDKDIFFSLLAPGERSALFISPSKIVGKYYREHSIYFFYLRLEDEIARVEIPEWVALDETLLNLAHSLIFDQCQRGQGYPVALSEAHEQAVVTGADRENFWRLVESSLIDEKLPTLNSAKSQSKKTRWV
jgi:hypothetical protein